MSRIPRGDPQALAEAVQMALELDYSQRAHMVSTGRARVLQRFSLTAIEQATLSFYARAGERGA